MICSADAFLHVERRHEASGVPHEWSRVSDACSHSCSAHARVRCLARSVIGLDASVGVPSDARAESVQLIGAVLSAFSLLARRRRGKRGRCETFHKGQKF